MKHLIPFCLAFAALPAAAQTLNSPESVEFHPRSGRLLISNTDNGEILWRAPDGTLSLFTSAPTAPYGIELLGGVVYSLDSGRLRGYDVDTAASVLDLPITGASFLNGITSDGRNTLYLTDFSARRLIKVDVSNLASPVQTLLQNLGPTPNGVVYDKAGNRLLIATWGSARVLTYDIAANTAPTVLINVTGYSNIDGIALDCAGNLLIAAWVCAGGGGCLRRFEPPFLPTSTPIVEGGALSNPADIDFGVRSGEIAIPETAADRISFVQRCEAALFTDDFER